MPDIILDGKLISYHIESSTRRKSISLIVDPKKGLFARIPKGVSEEETEDAIRKRSRWILSKLDVMKRIAIVPQPKEFVSGEKFLYIGRSYRLRVFKGKFATPSISYHQGKFIAKVPAGLPRESYQSDLRMKMIQWYKNRAEERFKDRMNFYVPRVGITPERFEVSNLRTRWGLRKGSNVISLNWKLIMAPMSIIDYVIVHELCHLVEPNHTRKFWRLLSTIIFDHKHRSEWLRVNGSKLSF